MRRASFAHKGFLGSTFFSVVYSICMRRDARQARMMRHSAARQRWSEKRKQKLETKVYMYAIFCIIHASVRFRNAGRHERTRSNQIYTEKVHKSIMRKSHKPPHKKHFFCVCTQWTQKRITYTNIYKLCILFFAKSVFVIICFIYTYILLCIHACMYNCPSHIRDLFAQ